MLINAVCFLRMTGNRILPRLGMTSLVWPWPKRIIGGWRRRRWSWLTPAASVWQKITNKNPHPLVFLRRTQSKIMIIIMKIGDGDGWKCMMTINHCHHQLIVSLSPGNDHPLWPSSVFFLKISHKNSVNSVSSNDPFVSLYPTGHGRCVRVKPNFIACVSAKLNFIAYVSAKLNFIACARKTKLHSMRQCKTKTP